MYNIKFILAVHLGITNCKHCKRNIINQSHGSLIISEARGRS